MAPQYGSNEPMSVRQAATHIAQRYTLDLGIAVFDTKDAKLMANAGSCAKCPKRTGNQPEIYPDAKNANVCTDPDCFAEKKAAHYKRIIVVANKKGIPVLEGDEADEAHPCNWDRDEAFVTEDHHLSAFDRVAPATGMAGTVKKHIDAEGWPTPVKYLKEDNGSVKALYRREDIQAVLEKTGTCETEQARADRLGADAAGADAKLTTQQERAAREAKEREERQKRCKTQTQERVARYRKLRSLAADGLTLDMLRELTKAIVLDDQGFCLPDDLIGDLYPFDDRSDEGLCAYIAQADMTTIQLLLMDLLIGESLTVNTWNLDEDLTPFEQALVAMAETAGVDVTPADMAVAGIDINALQNPEDVLAAITANIEHMTPVIAHIIDKAPHHIGNAEAAANALGYFYKDKAWHRKDVQAPVAAPADCTDEAESASAPRKTITLKGKPQAQEGDTTGPVIKVRKNRAAQAEASGDLVPEPEQAPKLKPAAAWPFPTPART